MRRINNVSLPTPQIGDRESSCWSIVIDEREVVIDLERIDSDGELSGEDWFGDCLSPMGIDLQINGGLGIDFTDVSIETLPSIFELLDMLWRDGIEAICPTFISSELTPLRDGLKVLHEARKYKAPNRCELLGAHLEGPFLSPMRNGAHPIDCLRPPSKDALYKMIHGYEGEIALMTLAPEQPGSIEVIKELKRLGVVICLGHSEADAENAAIAFENGITMITHSFNAMLGLHHREPGPVGQAIKHQNISLGLIADGAHVHPTVMLLLQKMASQKLVLVSDALPGYGVKDDVFCWGKERIFVNEGTCRFANGKLAGTSISLLEGVKRLSAWTREPLAAIWSATIAPRQVLSSNSETHEYLIGKNLNNLLRWHFNSNNYELTWQHAV